MRRFRVLFRILTAVFPRGAPGLRGTIWFHLYRAGHMGKNNASRCFIASLGIALTLAFTTAASAAFIWTSETRYVTNSIDFNNLPQVGSTTTSSTGHFEQFDASGRASQHSRFLSSGGAAHL